VLQLGTNWCVATTCFLPLHGEVHHILRVIKFETSDPTEYVWQGWPAVASDRELEPFFAAPRPRSVPPAHDGSLRKRQDKSPTRVGRKPWSRMDLISTHPRASNESACGRLHVRVPAASSTSHLCACGSTLLGTCSPYFRQILSVPFFTTTLPRFEQYFLPICKLRLWSFARWWGSRVRCVRLSNHRMTPPILPPAIPHQTTSKTCILFFAPSTIWFFVG
jgi:hypothetical protein